MLDTVAMVSQKQCYVEIYLRTTRSKKMGKIFKNNAQNVYTSFSSNDSLFEQNTVGWMIRLIGISHVAFGHKKDVLELLPLIRNSKSGTYYHHVLLLRYTNNIIFRENKNMCISKLTISSKGVGMENVSVVHSMWCHVCLYTSQYAVFMHVFGAINS